MIPACQNEFDAASARQRFMPPIWFSLATAVFLLGSTSAPAADASTTRERVERLVDRLAVAVREVDVDGTIEVTEELAGVGPDAVPILIEYVTREGQVKLEEPGLDQFLRRTLWRTIRQIPGDRTVEALLDLTLNHSNASFARSAGGAIPREAVLKREFSEAELETLIGRIGDNQPGYASHWALLLARAEHVDDERLTGAIIERFARAIKEDAGKAGASRYSRKLNREIVTMSRFLKVFPHLDDATVVPRLREARKRVEDESGRKWWLMALGMSGDRSVGEEVRLIVESTEEHISMPPEALRAYAHAMGRDALPLLQKYEQDTTPGPRGPDGLTPMQAVAREMRTEMEGRK